MLQAMLDRALNDEYRARATYRSVIERFGAVRPFTSILRSEQNHIDALLGLYTRYRLPVPADRWAGWLSAPPSLAAACAGGVAGEIANYRMYDAMLAQTAQADVRAVFAALRSASHDRHLPAFRACAATYASAPSNDHRSTIMGFPLIPFIAGASLGAFVTWLCKDPPTQAALKRGVDQAGDKVAAGVRSVREGVAARRKPKAAETAQTATAEPSEPVVESAAAKKAPPADSAD